MNSKLQNKSDTRHEAHLNYCRQLVKQWSRFLEIPSLDALERASCRHMLDLCLASKKFLLPEGGELLDDDELRGLQDGLTLQLPYPFIALEYRLETLADGTKSPSTRQVIFAREQGERIAIDVAMWIDAQGIWATLHNTYIDRTNYIDRSIVLDKGAARMKFRCPRQAGMDEEYGGAVGIVLSFLNALSCSNVHTQQSLPRHAGKKTKSAIPFDTYHVLTIDVVGGGHRQTIDAPKGEHRSPREHLRRGHIVRPEGRRPYWRNSTVVNAGYGFGQVTKDYRLRAAAP